MKAITHSKSALSQFQKDSFQQDSAAKNSVDLIYFQSKKSITTTSSSVVKGADIARTPVVPFPLAITGRLAGLQVSQGSGQPLNEGFSFNLRGQAPLVLIDGIPRNLTEIGNDEIESITVLKDAVSTAMLGIRGLGGAIVVTTKKGLENSQQINFTSQFGTQRPTKNLITQPLNSYQYATLYNEALANDGLSVLSNGFSPQALAGYQDGSDPFKYPNVNWQDEVLRKSSRYSRYNLNTRGGGKFAKYFVNLEHTNQEGIFKTDEINKYNTNASGKNYFMRSNLDMQINDKLSASVYIQGRILNRNEPGVRFSSNNIFSALTNTPRGAYPVFNPNNSYGGSSLYQNNIVAQSISSGYSTYYNRTVLSDFNIKRTLNEILPGLWVKARASFFSNLGENIVRNKTFATFENVGSNPTTGEAIYRQYGTTSQTSNTNFVDFQNRSDFQELSVGYSTKVKKNHELNGLLIANRDNLISGTNTTVNLPYTIQGISGHGDYNFKEKYMFEFSFGLNGANRNPPDGKFNYGFFPAVGLGWDISKEEFMQKSVWINQLKLYGSYGKTGR
ncbi:MAG: TonB-dependent receptor plug domain-containing protein, partial [Pyrinomonadaceae bacterium]|nr:TonB-dependent receptor plug domain-containing protein [Sphingobacteriaceae bacterium]